MKGQKITACSFISVTDGKEISPEHLFKEDWLETTNGQRQIDKSVIAKSIITIFETHKEKLKAFRHKDFILTSPKIESAIALN